MTPSQLREEQWIKITADTGAIGFHVYYGVLYCFAIDHDQPANNPEVGIQITTDPDTADRIYEHWRDQPQVTITTG